jgi:2-C-methyl-D-erythritol 4-phosphate cytidylyltransferase
MGGARPKVWLELGGAPILTRALATIAAWPRLASLAVVVRAEDVAEAEAAVAAAAKPALPIARVVAGGAERADSVRAGLAALAPAARIVLVHDAARPLASLALYERVAEAAEESGAAAPALALVDTLKRRDDAGRLTGVARDGLHALQTPQGFGAELPTRTGTARRAITTARPSPKRRARVVPSKGSPGTPDHCRPTSPSRSSSSPVARRRPSGASDSATISTASPPADRCASVAATSRATSTPSATATATRCCTR